MLLTGKAKKDFLVWLYSEYDFTEKTFNELYPENLKEWFIIKWFDSAEIYIDVFWSFGDFEFSIHTDNERNCLSVLCNSRQEATKYAILKANHTYNNR